MQVEIPKHPRRTTGLPAAVIFLLPVWLRRNRWPGQRLDQAGQGGDRRATPGRAGRLFTGAQAIPGPRRPHRLCRAKKPRSYDQLALDLKEGRWENWVPAGKEWGPRFGVCQPPVWKNEIWNFQDAEGNVRPNWTVYGTFSLGQKYDYDPDARVYFFAGGKTFSYDPVERQWTDLAPKSDPEKELGWNAAVEFDVL